jgi:GntR family transcriptional regulator, transcriptional repressor for pyruvate dehydrogenase complex
MSAVDKAFHGLRHMIATGRLGAGERIPPENELCEELGVSRGPLREAVRMLVALRIVEPRHGSGTYVSQLRPEDIIGSLSLTVDLLPLSGLLEVYELRRVLESHVAAQAAARVTPEALKTIFGHIEAMEAMEAMEDPSKISEIDHRFHTAIARIGGNPTLESLLGVFRARSRAYQVFTLPESAATAIANRAPVATASVAATHVAHTERWLHAFLPPEAGESPSTSS